ncbi:ABC transporter ATP-binding protein [Anaeromicropila herbilytica]|uniref:ABC transporter ATP-binding protein n=1 Tax=Anaeromicropila herbilytica TaxID=2785025 RepID=A0A7R7IBV9_9FIRM|nr:ABC transporter ATP-binding protein [Anaeromicropila herbilytica]BCN29211.1 ABC transporter ATP-binding protein [Anaeromicropila herbilytica]
MKNNIFYVFRYMKQMYWLLLGYAAIILECVTPIIATLLQKDMIDRVFYQKQYEAFLKIIMLYAIFFFAPRLMFTVRKVAFFHLSYELQMSLTEAFLEKIYNMPTADFVKEHVGELLNHIRTNVADAADLAVNQILSEAVKNVLTVALLIYFIGKINVFMLFIVVFVTFFYYGLLHIFGKKTKDFSQNVREQKGKVSITIEESVSSIREVVAYHREAWQLERYHKTFGEYFATILKQGFFQCKVMFVSAPFLYGTKLISILCGGIGVIHNTISLGEFVVGFTFVDQLVTELGLLFDQGLNFKKFEAAVETVQSVMNKEDASYGKEEVKERVQSICFHGVTFAYGRDKDPVIKDLSLELPVGKKIALVGLSGSGKSTIAQLLTRMYEPDQGEITMNGIPLSRYGEQYTEKVSIVFQQPYFIPSTIRENLTFDKMFSNEEIEKICSKMLCHEFIKQFPEQYETYIGERGAMLSGGQKQRLALSRAMLRNTDVLILDEATSALDTETEYQVQKNLDQLRKGKTTIIIAHRLSTIQNADIIYVLDKGQVLDSGSHNELLTTCKAYQELYMLQQLA